MAIDQHAVDAQNLSEQLGEDGFDAWPGRLRDLERGRRHRTVS
jgi:hypothetical protein